MVVMVEYKQRTGETEKGVRTMLTLAAVIYGGFAVLVALGVAERALTEEKGS